MGNWSESALKVLKERYLWVRKDGTQETPEEMFRRVADAIAGAELLFNDNIKQATKEMKKQANEFYEIMVDSKFLPNSPCLANAGRPSELGKQLSACYVLPVEDNLTSIFNAIKTAAIIHSSGGGTGFGFGRLRPEGCPTGGGTSSGPISFMRIFDGATQEIKQAGQRRGANMGVLPVTHPNIFEFIDCKRTGGITNFNISVAATDIFMFKVKNDSEIHLTHECPKWTEVRSVKARDIWEKICKAAWDTGDPGLLFIDYANNSRSNPVPDVEQLESTNPCVIAGTKILTNTGYINIEDVAGQIISVWNGYQFSPVVPRITGYKQRVMKVELSDGTSLTCTPSHKWILNGNNKVSTDKLSIGDQLHRFSMPVIVYGEKLENAYRHGFFCGDGHIVGNQKLAHLYADKKELAGVLSDKPARIEANNNRLSVTLPKDMPDKFIVPHNADLQSRLEWFAGLCDADGCSVKCGPNSVSIQLSSSVPEFLNEIRLMLTTLGVQAKVSKSREARQNLLPDGKGGNKLYNCQADYRLLISSLDVVQLVKLGFRPLRLNLSGNNPQRGASRFVTVKSVTEAGIADKVYCFTEPINHTGCFNGVITGQCGEVWLGPNDVCNLGSINVNKFASLNSTDGVDWDELENTVYTAIRFLDNLVEINPIPITEIKEKTLKLRRLGLGVMGWADLLITLGIKYDSQEALDLAEKLMKFIQSKADDASIELANLRGAFPLYNNSIYKDCPMRNGTRTIIAPTGTISIIAGCSSGIEPLFALSYKHNNQLGRELVFTNEQFNDYLEYFEIQNPLTAKEVKKHVENHGSLHGYNREVPELEMFRTAHEVAPEWHVKMQAAFQKYTDNSISKTVNLPTSATWEDIGRIYMMAYDLGCKGITVFRDGCKTGVLSAGTKEEPKKEEIKKPEARVIKDRPRKLKGVSYQTKTPFGEAYIHVNHDEDNNPLEVFTNIGKAGTDMYAVSEAIGRLCSLVLRMPSDLTGRQRIQYIAKQLEGIGGESQLGIGPKRVRSYPDAIAQVLRDYLSTDTESEIVSEIVLNSPSIGNFCPSCKNATLYRQEGCSKCPCGFSQC